MLRLSPRPFRRLALAILLGVLPGPAAASPGDLARKLDPALATWASGGSDTLTLWVGFAPRGSGDPAALAARLAEASTALTPRARARRLRARVWPLVDERDLAVEAASLEAVRGVGLAPFAVSRWLNRAAVRATPAAAARLAALDVVATLSPVARAGTGPGDRPGATVLAGGGHDAAGLDAAADAGLAAGQLAQIGATAMHDAGWTGAGVLVALLDEGFNFTWKHEALRDRTFAPGFLRDFVEGDTVVSDTTRLAAFEHGTWTLGCLAANRPGVYQGAGYGADVALARTEDHASETPVEMLYWAQAAEWADSLGADLISSSVGYHFFDSPFPSYGAADFDGHTTDISRAAEIAAAKGILVVNSAGNFGAGPPVRLVAPADVNGDSLIAVGAVDTFGTVSSVSSRGPTSDGRIKPDLVARGQDAWLVSARGLPNAYLTASGTSFSAPLVAGLAACLMEARPGLSAVGIVRALRETASSMCLPNNESGWGIPNGPAAVAWVPGPPGFERPPAGYLEMAAASANPFRPREAGPYRLVFGLGPRLADDTRGHVRVYDSSGREVRTLFYGSLTCGVWQTVEWNGRDLHGRAVKPGIYFVHFDAEGRTRTQRVVLLD